MDSKIYDILAWINRVCLPALITLVSAILGFCKVDAEIIAMVAGIMAAVNAFLGAILQDKKTKYFDGIKDILPE